MPTLLPTIHNREPRPIRTNPMTSGRASRARGRRWQTAVRQWLETHGHTVHERPAGAVGDDLSVYIDGLALSIECKSQTRLDLAGWITQATTQAPPGTIPVVVAKRRGKAAVGDAYAVMRCADLIRLLEGTTP